MSIPYKTSRFSNNVTGDKEKNIRVQLLSWETLDTNDFVEFLSQTNRLSKGDAYKALTMVLEGIEEVLHQGKIINLEDFGNFSLNGCFRDEKEPSEEYRAESIEVKNVIFKADKQMKKRLSTAKFEKFNPEKHRKRIY